MTPGCDVAVGPLLSIDMGSIGVSIGVTIGMAVGVAVEATVLALVVDWYWHLAL
jgi:hypothetical protein